MQNAIINFTNYKEDEIDTIGRKIFNDLTTNIGTFPGLPVPLPVLDGLITTYEGILEAPNYENRTNDLGAARVLLNSALHDDGVEVNVICKGNLVKLGLSGYPISKLAAPVGVLPAPVSAKIKNGAPLTFDFDIASVDNAAGYLVAITPVSNPETNPYLWRIVWSRSHTCSVGGNARGTEYKFAVCAVGAEDEVNWLLSGTTLFAQ
jgi:hypothetical protein